MMCIENNLIDIEDILEMLMINNNCKHNSNMFHYCCMLYSTQSNMAHMFCLGLSRSSVCKWCTQFRFRRHCSRVRIGGILLHSQTFPKHRPNTLDLLSFMEFDKLYKKVKCFNTINIPHSKGSKEVHTLYN